MNTGFLNKEQIEKLSKFCLELFKKFGDAPMGNLYNEKYKGKIVHSLKYESKVYGGEFKGCERYLIKDSLQTRIYFLVKEVKNSPPLLMKMSVLLNSSFNVGKNVSLASELLGMTSLDIYEKINNEIDFLIICDPDKIVICE